MNLAKNAPILNYRLSMIDRIAKLGTNKVTGEVEKIKTASGQVWSVADLTPQGDIIGPLDKEALDTCLLIVRECCLSDAQSGQQSAQDLELLGCLTQEQKQQVWGHLTGDEKQQLRKLKESIAR
ncbi:hypothetical protein [Adonisia turfae]|uniref:Uncharacterized protein n=1 Tax=Adonisia turfae CCMR0081 TaxID=2292702 RepID=A0A6M0RFN6_9CYAN|nr:hypothetical protein [Adonisia turfae]NEZ54969.1 hypothetical protein [Adonisia turfae CCMR0081]